MKPQSVLLFVLSIIIITACSQTPAGEIPSPISETLVPPTEIPTQTPAPTETPLPSPTSIPPTPTEDHRPIPWDQAKNFIDQHKTVCGPVKGIYFSQGSAGQPTFINIGKAYPHPSRFSAVIWGEDRENFSGPPEQIYADQNLCVTGTIIVFDGIPEIMVEYPSQITFSD